MMDDEARRALDLELQQTERRRVFACVTADLVSRIDQRALRYDQQAKAGNTWAGVVAGELRQVAREMEKSVE